MDEIVLQGQGLRNFVVGVALSLFLSFSLSVSLIAYLLLSLSSALPLSVSFFLLFLSLSLHGVIPLIDSLICGCVSQSRKLKKMLTTFTDLSRLFCRSAKLKDSFKINITRPFDIGQVLNRNHSISYFVSLHSQYQCTDTQFF